MAWLIEDADRCPGCGTQSYEADLFEVSRVICRTCRMLDLDRAEATGSQPPKKPGLQFLLKRRGNGK